MSESDQTATTSPSPSGATLQNLSVVLPSAPTSSPAHPDAPVTLNHLKSIATKVAEHFGINSDVHVGSLAALIPILLSSKSGEKAKQQEGTAFASLAKRIGDDPRADIKVWASMVDEILPSTNKSPWMVSQEFTASFVSHLEDREYKERIKRIAECLKIPSANIAIAENFFAEACQGCCPPHNTNQASYHELRKIVVSYVIMFDIALDPEYHNISAATHREKFEVITNAMSNFSSMRDRIAGGTRSKNFDGREISSINLTTMAQMGSFAHNQREIESRLSPALRHEISVIKPNAYSKRYFAATDACDAAGAIVNILTSRLIRFVSFGERWRTEHITRKETLMAIMCIADMLPNMDDNSLLVILVDNITAASVINKHSCVFNEELDKLVSELWAKAKSRNIAFRALYIPGHMQPADEPSRGLPLVPSKAAQALIFAAHRLSAPFEELFYANTNSEKRPRQEE